MSFYVDMDKNKGFFRKNGEQCIELNLNPSKLGYYPCVAMHSVGEAVQLLEKSFWEPVGTPDVSIHRWGPYYTPRKLCLWWVYCFHVRPSVRPSITLCFLNILKSHGWIFIKPCKHVHICKTNTLNKKVRARGQLY